MNTYILLAVALLPAIILCVFVFIKDRVEKEPVGLLLKLLVFGAIICFPAATIEVALGDVIESFFSAGTLTIVNAGGQLPYTGAAYIYILIKNIIGIALVEEGFKFLVLVFFTRKNKEFNSLFDGLIYAVFVSLGFAALENVFYVLGNGLQVGIMRAILSVPGHMFFAVMMGYHYSMWHLTDMAADAEKGLKASGAITTYAEPFNSKKETVMCLVVSTLAHGFYNTLCSIGTTWAGLCLYAFVIFMYVHCFKKINKMSQADASDNAYVNYFLRKKYPELND